MEREGERKERDEGREVGGSKNRKVMLKKG